MDSVRDNELQSLEMVYDGITYLYQLNLQGDVIALLNSSGGYVATYVYDAWGKVLSVGGSNTTIANANPLRYRGYYYDTESGRYYLQSRYYDPAVKRFINADGFASTSQAFLGYNMFAYSLNDPVKNADTEGYLAFIASIACGTILGGIGGAVGAVVSGNNVWAGMAIGAASGAIGAVSSVGMIGSIAISATAEIIEQKVNNPHEPIQWAEVGIAAGVGAFSGILGMGVDWVAKSVGDVPIAEIIASVDAESLSWVAGITAFGVYDTVTKPNTSAQRAPSSPPNSHSSSTGKNTTSSKGVTITPAKLGRKNYYYSPNAYIPCLY